MILSRKHITAWFLTALALLLLASAPCWAGIVNSEIRENQIQADGMRYVTYRYTFHNGDIINFYSMSKPGNYNVDQGLIDYQTEAKARAITQNDGKLEAQIDRGTLAPLDAEPAHPNTMTLANRKKRLLRKLLKRAARSDDLKEVRRIFYPVWYYLKHESGYTPTQIANYLGMSVAKLGQVNTRFQALHDHLTLIDNDAILEVDE